MAGQWDEWLAELRAANKGPVEFRGHRGLIFSRTVYFPGDLTGTTIRGEVRASPDGSPLAVPAEFAVSAPSVAGEQTAFNIALTANQTFNMPEDEAGSGTIRLVYTLFITRPSFNEELLWGGEFVLTGYVTQPAD